MLHLFRFLIFDINKQNYNINLLEKIKYNEETISKTINIKLKTLLEKITLENENSEIIKNEFSNIVSNIPDAIDKKMYKRTNYELLSSHENFNFIISYLLGVENISQLVSKKIMIKETEKSYKITFIKNKKKIKPTIIINVLSGHTTVGYVINYKKYLNTYKYNELILFLSNKYYIHDKTNFNITPYLKAHIETKTKKLPIYLKNMLLNNKMYFFSEINTELDLVNIIHKNHEFLEFFYEENKNFNQEQIINFIIKSHLIRNIFYKIEGYYNSDITSIINKYNTFLFKCKDYVINKELYNFIEDEHEYLIDVTITDYTIKNFAQDLIKTHNNILNKETIINRLFII